MFLPDHSYFCSRCRRSLVLALLALPSSRLESDRKACPWHAMKHSMSLVLRCWLLCLRCRVCWKYLALNLLLMDRYCRNGSSASPWAVAPRLNLSSAACSLFLLVLHGWESFYSSKTPQPPAEYLQALCSGLLPLSMLVMPFIIFIYLHLQFVVDSSPNSEHLSPTDSYCFSKGFNWTWPPPHLNYITFVWQFKFTSEEIGCSRSSFSSVVSLLFDLYSISMFFQPFLAPFRSSGTCLEWLPIMSLWNYYSPLSSRRAHLRSTVEKLGSSFAGPISHLQVSMIASNCQWCGHSLVDEACSVAVGRLLSYWVLELQDYWPPFSPGSRKGRTSVGFGPCPNV